MIRTVRIARVVLVCVLALPAAADWNPGDPYKMHWPQLPDLSSTGMDVYDTTYWWPTGVVEQKWLADDFLCTQTGPITGIHLWGSWLNDRMPPPPAHGVFQVAIYSDIPAGQSPTGYSMPGQLLWTHTFYPGSYGVRLYGVAQEHFWDPNTDTVLGFDSRVVQYNFALPSGVPPFVQQQGSIYWLAVTQFDPNGNGVIDPQDREFIFGWKTTPLPYHWNDDAVFTDGPAGFPPAPPVGGWSEMRYPAWHPWAGQSLDLAFVIVPEPAGVLLAAAGALLMRRRVLQG